MKQGTRKSLIENKRQDAVIVFLFSVCLFYHEVICHGEENVTFLGAEGTWNDVVVVVSWSEIVAYMAESWKQT